MLEIEKKNAAWGIEVLLAEGWSCVGNNVVVANNNLLDFDLLFTGVIEACAVSKTFDCYAVPMKNCVPMRNIMNS